eukprot:9737726-Lingulodinium_polyedra.AAC.1
MSGMVAIPAPVLSMARCLGLWGRGPSAAGLQCSWRTTRRSPVVSSPVSCTLPVHKKIKGVEMQ